MTTEEILEIKRRAYETMQSIDETLAATTPEPAQQWQPTRYRRYDQENKARDALEEKLKDAEARMNKRIDALEASLQTIWKGLELLADEGGSATGQLEKKLREEHRKEIETLRSEVALSRAHKTSTPQGRKTVSRAPWKDIDASITAN